jgi:hypothetical protein
MNIYNNIIIENIRKKLPENVRIADYLSDVLIIGKEPAYRRIRNHVPFTFDEVVKIAKDLHLSVDNIIRQSDEGDIVQFKLNIPEVENPSRLIIHNLEMNVKMLEMLSKAKNIEIKIGLNRLIWPFLPFPKILWFEYCRLMYSFNSFLFDKGFADMEMPKEIDRLHGVLISIGQKLSNITYVIDERVIEKVILEIRYYHHLNLLSKKEVSELQKELFEYLDYLMAQNIEGRTQGGGKRTYYISRQSVDTNCVYVSCDSEEFVKLYIYFENPIVIYNNPQMSQIQKRWFESQKKTAVLVTRSNELLLSEFYNRMRVCIASLLPSEPA